MWNSTISAAILLGATLLPVSLAAQWPDNDKTVPRNTDGTPILSGPAPRRPDGRPDLTGLWTGDPPRFRDLTLALRPGDAIVMKPEAAAIFDQRKTGALSRLEPDANCLPQGVPKVSMTPSPFKIFQQPDVIVILYESFSWFRQLFMDGRQLPRDPNPQWLGYSVARWDGDTLVVDSSGFNGKAWLDQRGHPSTESLRVTERFRRSDIGHLELQATIDDPGAYVRPFTVIQSLRRVTDGDLIENVCNENNKRSGASAG
jgi:hypothetical protein